MTEKNKPQIGFMCSYVPHKFLERLGFEMVSLIEITGIKQSNITLPSNMCSYVRFLEQVLNNVELDGIIVTNCCNGMQRLYDLICEKYPHLFCGYLELPREDVYRDWKFFKDSFYAVVSSISDFFNLKKDYDFYKMSDEVLTVVPPVNYQYIYLFGSAVSYETKMLLIKNSRYPFADENTCSERNNGDAILQIIGKRSLSKEAMDAYGYRPCARISSFTEWFYRYLSERKGTVTGIIDIYSQNCDTYLIKIPLVREICRKNKLPLLTLEDNFQMNVKGQTLTRLDAFYESIEIRRGDMPETGYEGIEKEIYPISDLRKNTFLKRIRLIDAVIPQLPLEAIKKIVEYQRNMYVQRIIDKPDSVIWTSMIMSVELFYAAELIPVNLELTAGWLASLRMSGNYLAVSEAMGINTSVCSYHKAALGIIEAHDLPCPKGIAVSSFICDGSAAVAHYWHDKYGTKSFVLNIPFHNTKMNKDYLIAEYKKLIKWLEDYTQKPFDYKKLRKILELSNQARAYWIKANHIRKGEVDFQGQLAIRNLFGSTFLFGTQEGCEIAKAYFEQLITLAKKDPKADVKKRLLWIHFAPLYNNEIIEYLEGELNCAIVMDITGYIYWEEYDLDKPLESLAQKTISHFYSGSAQNRKKLYENLIRDYRIDGIVHFMHNGCRAIPGGAWQIRELASENHIAYLELPGDCIDPRGFSNEQTRLRLEAFCEMLGGEKHVFRN